MGLTMMKLSSHSMKLHHSLFLPCQQNWWYLMPWNSLWNPHSDWLKEKTRARRIGLKEKTKQVFAKKKWEQVFYRFRLACSLLSFRSRFHLSTKLLVCVHVMLSYLTFVHVTQTHMINLVDVALESLISRWTDKHAKACTTQAHVDFMTLPIDAVLMWWWWRAGWSSVPDACSHAP